MLEVAYAGSHGTHLVMKQDVNQAPPRVGVTNLDVNRPYYITISPLLRGLSQVKSTAWSTHNALQGKLNKRFSKGFTGTVSYTYGKTLDIVSDTEGATLNAYNFNQDRGLAQFDVAHTLTLSWLYELPFGRGKALGAGMSPVLDKVLGGWEINGITLVRTGLPINITQQQGMLSTGTGNRPDRIASGKLDNPAPDRWFDTAAFVPTRDNSGTYGNSGRNILRAPGQVQFDLGIFKKTRFRERFEHQLRFELFNAFNHPQFRRAGNRHRNRQRRRHQRSAVQHPHAADPDRDEVLVLNSQRAPKTLHQPSAPRLTGTALCRTIGTGGFHGHAGGKRPAAAKGCRPARAHPTDFVISSAQEEAAWRAIQDSETVTLSARDQAAFVKALLRPPAPDRNLRTAWRRFEQGLR